MATSIDTNPFPLGFIQPTPGQPLNVLALISDFDSPYVNGIKFQAGSDNAGRAFIGTPHLNTALKRGMLHELVAGGDTVAWGTIVQNVYRLADFYVDVEVPGDGVWVVVYIR